VRQQRPFGALTKHYVEQHNFQRFPRINTGQEVTLEPLWMVKDQAAKNLIETCTIKATSQGQNTLNKDPGPAGTGLSDEITRRFTQFQSRASNSGAIPQLKAKPTLTRNHIASCLGPVLPRPTSSTCDLNSSSQVPIPHRIARANAPPRGLDMPA
jgi:hypothetical protein